MCVKIFIKTIWKDKYTNVPDVYIKFDKSKTMATFGFNIQRDSLYKTDSVNYNKHI